MSFRLPASHPPVVEERLTHESSSDEDEDEEETWDDWHSDSGGRTCKSLFDDKTFSSAAEALSHDKSAYGFDLEARCQALGLDFYQRVRLVNYIRQEKVSPTSAQTLNGKEALFSEDRYLKPVIDDDALIGKKLCKKDFCLLRESTDFPQNTWTDSDDETGADNTAGASTEDAYRKRIKNLEKKVELSKRSLQEYREMMQKRLGVDDSAAATSTLIPPPRDDDSHYFRSYAENDIHSVMLQDTVRTSTYASFILSNAHLFENAIVLDVGCGTGILSLFAARAGAKHVYAVDASDIADKAAEIVKANGMSNCVTVIKGRVEDIQLPVEKVDVIVSEWMAYALLYESMLDSVLKARDRFLRRGGVIAPSEGRMQLALCDPVDIRKDRVGFWQDVYGFDMSTMTNGVYEEAIIGTMPPEAMLSAPTVLKTLDIYDLTPKQLDFAVPFTLTSTSSRRTKVHAFLLYFDIFFNTVPELTDPGLEAHVVKEGEGKVAEVWPIGRGRGPLRRRASSRSAIPTQSPTSGEAELGKVVSFTTGPMSIPTHWQQTVFLLKDPIPVQEGTVVSGNFHCRKSPDNSRELNIEIHYSITAPSDGGTDSSPSETFVQLYKVH